MKRRVMIAMAGPPAGAADRRQAHDRAGRDDPGAGAEPAGRAAAPDRHGHHLRHPRPGGGGRDRRRGGGGVRRPRGRARAGGRVFERPAHPYIARPARGVRCPGRRDHDGGACSASLAACRRCTSGRGLQLPRPLPATMAHCADGARCWAPWARATRPRMLPARPSDMTGDHSAVAGRGPGRALRSPGLRARWVAMQAVTGVDLELRGRCWAMVGDRAAARRRWRACSPACTRPRAAACATPGRTCRR